MKDILKVVVFCPESHTDKVIKAMADKGAGVIGDYTHCAYITKGFGNWMPEDGSDPYSGKVGQMSREEENRIEMACPKDKVNNVVQAIKEVHPYETPEIDVYEIKLV
jgi:hypothetical protein